MPDFNYISATQINTFLDCIRKWFFETTLKLPVEKGYHFAFGQVFHSVCARYLNASDDEDGLVLYPKGWLETDDGIVTPDDAGLIEQLMLIAIREGILERFQGREVEKKFTRQITDNTILVGFIDLRLPFENKVVDHKTTKDFRYALSEEALKTDMQMLIYAAEHAIRWKEDYDEELESVILRHNQFLKDPKNPKVKFTEAAVSIDAVENAWMKCQKIAHEMAGWRLTSEENWDKVPGPKDYNICNKYGGCPFLRICGKTETPTFYRKRTNRILDNVGVPVGEKEMSLFDQLKGKKGKTEKEEKPKEEKTEESKVFQTPPWANPECQACSGAGLNTKGNPCRICDQVAKAKGESTSSAYEFKPELDGWVLIGEEKEEKKPESIATADPSKIKNTGLKKALLKKQGKTENEVEQNEEGEGEESEEKPETKGEEKKKKGRPPKGFTLCVNCCPTSFGSRDVMSMDSIFQDTKGAVEEMMGGPFYEQDQWKRKDSLAVAVSHIVEQLGSAYVVANPAGNGLDYKACLEALRGYAQTVIEGLS